VPEWETACAEFAGWARNLVCRFDDVDITEYYYARRLSA